jgi:alanine transaminase
MSDAITVATLNHRVVDAEYAVRGPIVAKAQQLEKDLKAGKALPFDKVVYCNIGNPHSLGQKPISFFRQVLAAIDCGDAAGAFAADVRARAEECKAKIKGGTGAYSESKGVESLRERVVKGITKRDGIPANIDDVYLIDGASAGCHYLMNVLIRGEQDAIMCPIPQYPLYSAALTLYGGTLVPYYLDEETGWSMNVEHVKSQLNAARAEGKNVRALVVINPGNPTGNLLSDDNLLEIAKFCADEGLLIISDEVYQENVYADGKKFKSMRKVVLEAGLEKRVALASFQSISKGYYGECGRRGGFMELIGAWEQGVLDTILKLASIALCPNLAGQIVTSMVMDPPVEGDPSYKQFAQERDDILASLKRRSITLSKALNALEGVTCQPADGAMYCFPNLVFPQKYLDECTAANKVADAEYCTRLLLATGIVTVPGSGFGQKPGTWHFRTTFLPSEEDINGVAIKLTNFHSEFMSQYK